MEDYRDFFPSEVFAVTTDREIDFSFPGDGEIFSKEQVRFLKERLQIDAGRVSNIRQVHGEYVVKADPAALPEADAQITNQKGVALAVRTADCLPVFLFDREHRAIGLVHAGWKGTRSGITAGTLRWMAQEYGTKAADVLAVLGPAISRDSYEVGPEFRQFFSDDVTERNGKLYLDLSAANKTQLKAAGVAEENIQDSGICSYKDPGCFSYRREKDAAGRMLSVIMLRS